MTMSIQQLPFDQRACFIGGPAKSGTTLLRALLDGHPQLLALPQDTDYFSTVLTKYGGADRRAQVEYLTKQSYAKILFGGKQREGKHDYSNFPQAKFLEIFERTAFDPANANRDLLALLMQSYAELLGIPLDLREISAREIANDDARPARVVVITDRAQAKRADAAHVDLLRGRSLAREREAGVANSSRRSPRLRREIRRARARHGRDDETSVRLPRN